MNIYSKRNNFSIKIICTLFIFVMQLFVNVNYYNIKANAAEDNIQLDGMYISEENYEEDMKNTVEPYINSKLQSGYIDGDEGVNVYYEKYKVKDPIANIVICHGFSESLEKYHEIIYYFLKSGYNVFGIEHRGHGRSGTLGIADKTQVHVKDFNQYISDFKVFMDEVVVPSCDNKKLLLFAHSMGGAIGTNFLEDYPNYFEKAVLNAPMLEVNTGNIPKFLAKIVVNLEMFIGNDGKYVIGKKPYSPEYDREKINTTSLNRYKYVHDIALNNEQFQRGGPSYSWLNEAFKVTEKIVKDENASKVKIPVLLFQAGQDFMVKPGGQNEFAKGAKDCKLEKITNSRHEIYGERDEIQKPYLEKVLNFYNN